MGKNFLKKTLARLAQGLLVIAVMSTAIAFPQESDFFAANTANASATDYDAKIAELEKKAEELAEKNKQREQQIDTISDDIDENEQVISLVSDQIDGVQDEIATYGQLITTKQEEISMRAADISALEMQISDKEAEIANKNIEISELQAQNTENLNKFKQLIRALYMNDTSDNIPLLDGSDNWYDFFVYTDVVQNISRQNLDFMNSLLDAIHNQQNLIKELNDDISALDASKQDYETQLANLESERETLESEKDNLSELVTNKYNELYQYTSYTESLMEKVDNLKYQISQSNEEVEEINSVIEELIREKQSSAAGAPVYSSDGFRWPLDTNYQYITTYFGYDAWRSGNHYGIDVGNAGIGGANIYAAQSGTVITAYNDGGYHGGFGNYIIIDHGGSVSTVYAHCRSVIVTVGQEVQKGDVIGYVGTTGFSTGNHLHFETRVNGTAQNPFNYTYEYV